MRNAKSLIPLLAFFCSWQWALAGDIVGKVTLSGTPPPEKQLPIDQNETCSPLHSPLTTTRNYVVGKDHGLANVFVYISKGLEGKKFSPPKTAVEINQSACMYYPFVTGVMVGQVLKFKNSDPVLHNVHAYPQNDGNQEFNFAEPTQGEVNDTKWTANITKPEVMVQIKCDVHEWMYCYVGVQDNPFFAVTDTNGNFKISDVPPGSYVLNAFHLKATAGTPGMTNQVTVSSSPVTANFTLTVPEMK